MGLIESHTSPSENLMGAWVFSESHQLVRGWGMDETHLLVKTCVWNVFITLKDGVSNQEISKKTLNFQISGLVGSSSRKRLAKKLFARTEPVIWYKIYCLGGWLPTSWSSMVPNKLTSWTTMLPLAETTVGHVDFFLRKIPTYLLNSETFPTFFVDGNPYVEYAAGTIRVNSSQLSRAWIPWKSSLIVGGFWPKALMN